MASTVIVHSSRFTATSEIMATENARVGRNLGSYLIQFIILFTYPSINIYWELTVCIKVWTEHSELDRPSLVGKTDIKYIPSKVITIMIGAKKK